VILLRCDAMPECAKEMASPPALHEAETSIAVPILVNLTAFGQRFSKKPA